MRASRFPLRDELHHSAPKLLGRHSHGKKPLHGLCGVRTKSFGSLMRIIVDQMYIIALLPFMLILCLRREAPVSGPDLDGEC